MNFSIDRRANIHSWARTGPPALKNGMKESVFVPLGPLNDDVQRDQYITEFNILYGEHIEGFKKIKKEKGDKERNMEWRQRLKRKQERNGGSSGGGGGGGSSSISSSSSSKSRNASGRGRQKHKQNEGDRDRLKAIQAYKKLKAERGSKGNLHNRFETNARSKGNSKPPMTMQNSSSMNEFESSVGDSAGRSTTSTTGNSGSSGGSGGSGSSGSSGNNGGGGGKKRLSKAQRKKLKAQGKR